MKKFIFMAVFAAMMTSCGGDIKDELDEVCIELSTNQKEETKPTTTTTTVSDETKQDPNFRIFNDKIKGAKGQMN